MSGMCLCVGFMWSRVSPCELCVFTSFGTCATLEAPRRRADIFPLSAHRLATICQSLAKAIGAGYDHRTKAEVISNELNPPPHCTRQCYVAQ